MITFHSWTTFATPTRLSATPTSAERRALSIGTPCLSARGHWLAISEVHFHLMTTRLRLRAASRCAAVPPSTASLAEADVASKPTEPTRMVEWSDCRLHLAESGPVRLLDIKPVGRLIHRPLGQIPIPYVTSRAVAMHHRCWYPPNAVARLCAGWFVDMTSPKPTALQGAGFSRTTRRTRFSYSARSRLKRL